MLNRTLSPTPIHSHLRVIRDEESPAYDADFEPHTADREPFVILSAAIGETILGTLGPAAFAVYWHLNKRSKDGQCWPSRDDIAEATTLSIRHVSRMLDALEDGGWITRTNRSNRHGMSTSTLYTIIVKERTDRGDIPRTSHGHDDVSNGTRTRLKPDVNQNDKESIATSPKKRTPYPEEFEAFWQAYPKDHGTKSLAFAEWRKLTPDDQALAIESLAGWKVSRRWQEGYIRDAERFLKHRLWEAIPEPSTVTSQHNGAMPPEIERLPWNNAQRMKWDFDHRAKASQT